jgi:hypothetical protein
MAKKEKPGLLWQTIVMPLVIIGITSVIAICLVLGLKVVIAVGILAQPQPSWGEFFLIWIVMSSVGGIIYIFLNAPDYPPPKI